MRIQETKRATRGSYNVIDFEVVKSAIYKMNDQGIAGRVFDEDIEDAEAPLNAKADETKIITEKMLLDKEQQALSVLNATTFSGYATQLSGTSKFSDYTNSDPFKVIQNSINAVIASGGKIPNTMGMAYDVYSELINHPAVLERFPGASVISMDMIKAKFSALFGIKDFRISMAQYTNTNKGASSEPLSFLMAGKIVLYYTEKASKMSRSFGKTFEKKGGLQIASYGKTILGESAILAGVDSLILAQWQYDQVIVAIDTAHLIYDVV